LIVSAEVRLPKLRRSTGIQKMLQPTAFRPIAIPRESNVARLHRSVSELLRMIASLSGSLVELIFPPRCIACGTWHHLGADPLCGECRKAINRECAEPSCPTCAAPVSHYEVSLGRCGQ
jgi:hypothetical protein